MSIAISESRQKELKKKVEIFASIYKLAQKLSDLPGITNQLAAALILGSIVEYEAVDTLRWIGYFPDTKLKNNKNLTHKQVSNRTDL